MVSIDKEPNKDIIQKQNQELRTTSYEQALESLQSLLSKFPDSFKINILLGSNELRNNNPDKALEYFTKSHELGCEENVYKNNIAAVENAYGSELLLKKEYKPALDHFLKALKLIITDPLLIYVNIHRCYRMLNEFDLAENVLFEYLKTNKKSAVVYFNLFEFEEIRKNYFQALTYAKTAYDLTISDNKIVPNQRVQLYVKYARLLENFGRVNDRIKVLIKAHMIAPTNLYILNLLAVTFITIGDYNKADHYILEAIKLDDNLPFPHTLYAHSTFKSGKIDDAKELYDTLIKRFPDYNPLNPYFAEFCFFCENYKDAYKYYKNSQSASIVTKEFINTYAYKELECLYYQKKYDDFDNTIKDLVFKDIIRPNIASISSFKASLTNSIDNYTFSQKPFDAVHSFDLMEDKDFDRESLIDEFNNSFHPNDFIFNLESSDILNGYQTTGNIFLNNTKQIQNLKNIIKDQLDVFINNYQYKNDELVKSWNDDYVLVGKIGKFGKGGSLKPYIKQMSWVSGIINLSKSDEGLDIYFTSDPYSKNYNTKKNNLIKFNQSSVQIFPSSIFTFSCPSDIDYERLFLFFYATPKKRYN